MNRNYKALELDKILNLLANETSCEDAAEMAYSLEPSSDLTEVRRRMGDTADAAMLLARFGGPSFGQIKNVAPSLHRADAGATLSMRELLDIAETLRVIRSLKEWRSRCEGVKTRLDDRFEILAANKYLEEKINTAILSEEEMADNASSELADIRRRKRRSAAQVRDQLDRMIRSPIYQKVLQDPIVTIRGDRFVIPVKAEHRSEVPGLVHDTSSSGATVFIEPMSVVEANNELRVLLSREEAEMQRILAELSAEAGNFAQTILEDYHIVIELNFIFAKAQLAYKMKATEPKLTDDGHVLLRRARHPLIDPKKAVPIDVELGNSFDTLVITGPNTGGKTVTLKTIGLLSLMVMCGLMPPVSDGSSLSIFREVLADIGDEQSIEQSLSTFSAHMTNLIRILQEADGQCLVLLDELGAGTDPVEGAALAIAILERLRIQGARIAATTHYAELKAFAIHTNGVENGSCEFDVATLRPTYRLLVGVPGRSNAFAISERLGMDKILVNRAKELVSGDNQRLEEVVAKLEEKRQTLEHELDEAQSERAKAQTAGRQAEEQLADLDRKREKEIERAKGEARRIIDRARAEAERMMEELDTLRKQKNSIETASQALSAKSRLRSSLRKMENTIDPVIPARQQSDYKLPRPLKAGDDVLIIDINKKGVVLLPPDDSGNVTVQAGIIKTRVSADNLKLVSHTNMPNPADKKASRPIPSTRNIHGLSSRVERSAKTEIDLRGKVTDEGILELDQFIDNAVMSGIEMITVIHGKGTGALRAAVQQHLRSHPSVKSFRLGVYGEGENGVTIVELK